MELSRIKPGWFGIIRSNGTEELFRSKPTNSGIKKVLSADYLDTVPLKKDSFGMAEVVMLVDDAGRKDGKPLNAKATNLYRATLRGVGWMSVYIHGDVALVCDGDFRERSVAEEQLEKANK